jgi:hypothetical protein
MTDVEIVQTSEETPRNPYCPFADDECVKLAPFTGRRAAFEYLQQQLTAPTHRTASVLLGGRHSGKTTLLHYFRVVFDENTIGVFLPLKHLMLSHETNLLLTLAHSTTALLLQLGFLLNRLPPQPEDDREMRQWFAERFLPEIFMVIRPHRRLVFLLDDAEELIDAVMLTERMPKDTFDYLHGLLQKFPQLGLVMTIDTDYEAHIPSMSPLVDSMHIHRLSNMSAQESAWLVQYPTRKLYTVSDEAAAAVHKATGGQPQLLQSFGYHLFERWRARRDQTQIGLEVIQSITPVVYEQVKDEFRWLWGQLSRNERLVLTAVSTLLYHNPLQTIGASAIETWLVESDYLLDMTAINAAIRGLEYREALVSEGQGVAPAAGLFQTWLLDNARLDSHRKDGDSGRAPRPRGVMLAVVLVLLIAVVLVTIALNSAPRSNLPDTILPTVTLAEQD